MQPTPQCQYEWLISALLTSCNFLMKLFVFYRITNRNGRQTSRMLYSVTDLPTVTSNMISKVKHVGESDSSNLDFSLGLKEVFIETKGVYQRTQIKKGVAIPLDYK